MKKRLAGLHLRFTFRKENIEMASLAQKLTDLTRKYGVAWVIINQTLGWITYIMIWIVLERTEYDVLGW
jgi:hypothetical protein